MFRSIELKTTLMATLVGAFLLGIPAKATVIYNLTDDQCTGGCLPPSPAGTVTVAQNGANDVRITVSLVSPDLFVNTGIQNTFDFNIVGAPTIAVTFVNNTGNFALVSTTAGAFHMAALGTFEYSITCCAGQGGGNAVSGPLTFDVVAAGLTEASFNSLGGANNNGGSVDVFGADIFNPTRNATGPVGSGPGSTVPEPITSGLVGTGLVSLFFLRRRAKQ
jgi:hypothetical protein